MNVSFEATAPTEGDFHGIRALLLQVDEYWQCNAAHTCFIQLFMQPAISASELSDLVLAQADQATVVKVFHMN